MKNFKKMLLLLAAIAFQNQPLEAQCLTQKFKINGRDSTANDPLFWNSPDWWDPKTSSRDLADAPTQLAITVADTCGGVPGELTYNLFMDLDGDGKRETRVRGDSTVAAGHVQYGNLLGLGQKRQFDFCPVPPQFFYYFAVDQSVSGNVRTGRLVWRTAGGATVLPQLPYGSFGIEWFCGGKKVGAQKFLVRDVLPPMVVCLGNLIADISPNNTVKIFGENDLLKFVEDGNTPAGQFKFSIRKKSAGKGFPLDKQGNPIPSVGFGCDELGDQAIELWARDVFANAAFCEVTVKIQDPKNYCADSLTGRTICLETETGQPIQKVVLQLSGTPPGLPPVNLMVNAESPDGCFEVKKWFGGVPFSHLYGITIIKDDDPLNGVDSNDVKLLTQHVLGIKPLNSLYKLIAADVNRSGSTTSNDAVILKKVIDGLYSNFPQNTSWQFVPKDFELQLPSPNNPFSPGFPLDPFYFSPSDSIWRFVGIKTGDLDNSADPTKIQQSDDRAAKPFSIENQFVVYPNPTGGEFFIEKLATTDVPAFFEIFDALGRPVRRGEFAGRQAKLDLQGLPAGQFLLKILSGGEIFTQILIKN